MKPIYLIVAVDQDNGFSKDQQIPWYLKEDLIHFRKVTTCAKPNHQNAVIMGRITYESMGSHTLSNRLNIVVSSTEQEGVLTVSSLYRAILECETNKTIESIFIIGGERLYREALDCFPIRGIYRTVVLASFDCDRFFVPIHSSFQLIHETQHKENDLMFLIQTWAFREIK